VALTRAKERLYLTCASQRMLFGRTSANLPSRFVKEIPDQLIQHSGRQRQQRQEYFREDTWGGETVYSQIPVQPRRPEATSKPRPSGTSVSGTYRKPAPKAAPLPQLRKGDMIRHSAFGAGMILSIQPMGGDALLEVAFDNVGTKRMMLKAASQFITKQ
jgi:DNA helicase-2/ATP-dependent DNA helicase PcrA